MERMNITFVPWGNMVVLSSSIFSKSEQNGLPREYKGYKWPTQQHSEP